MTDLAKIAERNLRTYLSGVPFRNEVDREAALACVDVLVANSPPQAAGGEPVDMLSANYKAGFKAGMEFEAEHHLLTDHPSQAAVGDEWMVVPRMMTVDMEVAFCEAWFSKKRCVDDADMQDAYAAMIEAAPALPAGGGVADG